MDKMEQNPPPPGFAAPPYTPYPQPPPPSQPQPPPQPSVIITAAAFGPQSQHLTCPHCRANISTRVETEANMKTHLIALLLCALGLWCCVPCPYCMDSCLATKHYCPSCGSYLGIAEN
ncbi:LITAF domain-containing protein [Camponotus japonicus]